MIDSTFPTQCCVAIEAAAGSLLAVFQLNRLQTYCLWIRKGAPEHLHFNLGPFDGNME